MLTRAVNSVYAQSYKNYEIIVVDDGSVSSVEDVLAGVADERLILVRQMNRGAAAARNTGIRLARGEYISFLDDDDEYLSTFMEHTLDGLSSGASHGHLSWCDVRFLEYSDATLTPTSSHERLMRQHDSQIQVFEDLLASGTGCGLTVSINILKKVGRFNEQLACVEDTDLFFRILIAGFQPTPIRSIEVQVHNHKGKRLTNEILNRKRIEECIWLTEEYELFLRKHPTLKAQLFEQIKRLRLESMSGPI